MAPAELEIVGAPGSPYTRKLRAVLRYRRIPHRFIIRGSKEDQGIPDVPVRLMPVLVLSREDGSRERAMIDSTFQIRELEARYAGWIATNFAGHSLVEVNDDFHPPGGSENLPTRMGGSGSISR